jgi:uncharacterized tellurite resistance protein B-like protein
MDAERLAMLKGLVSVAWADGRVSERETEMLEALIVAFGATPSEALEIRHFASEVRSLADVPIHDLGYHDRRALLGQAVLLTFVDGEQQEREREVLKELGSVLRIPAAEARGIVEASEQQARELLPLLER